MIDSQLDPRTIAARGQAATGSVAGAPTRPNGFGADAARMECAGDARAPHAVRVFRSTAAALDRWSLEDTTKDELVIQRKWAECRLQNGDWAAARISEPRLRLV